MKHQSMFLHAEDIVPQMITPHLSVPEIIEIMGKTSFEARNLYHACALFSRMIHDGDTIWLGIAGAGIAGGMGGMVISLIQTGAIDVICSTGAQVYHDLHFAFELPVKAIHGIFEDDVLRKHGDVRIYDIGIREDETLEAQDEIIRQFVKADYEHLSKGPLSSWEFNYRLGLWVLENSAHPERSFVAAAAKYKVPIFWDSLANHSIAMNLARTDLEGYPIQLSPQKDIFDSASIAYGSQRTGFVLLGGGGPKNFIQQTGPTVHQILGVDYEGAERGVQIGTAMEREGSLSGCTFSEAVSWGKYKTANEKNLVQIWAEYSLVFPLMTAYALEKSKTRESKQVVQKLPDLSNHLRSQMK